MVHRFVGGIAAVLLVLTSCAESAPPQTPPETSPSSAAFPVTIDAANGTVTIDRAPNASSRCRRPRPRCCSRSAQATRWRRWTTSRTTRRTHRSPICRGSNRTSRRSPRSSPTSSSTRPSRATSAPRSGASASRRCNRMPRPRSTTCISRSISSGRPRGTCPRRRPRGRDASGHRGIVESIDAARPALTFYHELDDTFYSVTSSTFIGQLYPRRTPQHRRRGEGSRRRVPATLGRVHHPG